MPIKEYKPTSPGRRGMTGSTFEEITKWSPEKSLLSPLKSKAGRNNQGRITVRHRGGGAKRMYRRIDFRRDKRDMPGEVIAIEYDPNRSSRIALIQYTDGERRYILSPIGLKVGDKIHVKGHTTDFELKVGSMQIERKSVKEAKKGEHIGIKVPDKVRPNDTVFLVD